MSAGAAGVRAKSCAVEQRRLEWLAAMRWRRKVEAVLASTGVTFTQWLVLDALEALIREADEAVSQSAVAARLELDRTTISQVMIALDRKHLVGRGISYMSVAWRVLLTHKARRILAEYRGALEAVSE